MELNREHFRAIIYYNFQRQLSQQECLAELLSVFGNEAPSVSLSDDPRVGNVDAIEASLKISKTSIQKNLYENQEVNWCQKRLTHCYGDESWIYCYEPENKRQSAVWVFQGEEKPTKVIPGHIATIPLNEQELIILHQDNASSHTAQKTRHPNDFFTFLKIKNRLRGQRFQSPEEEVDAFKNAGLDAPANEWNKCFENWFERMQMCINLRGEYFEKQ
ncbi:unnamed protein product [Acanthoscelides obtectus]|uniref:Transposase n=1 Tax=Acanthoscelides obtectus TaxID=200917 RepID=A0A9P0VV63_ACAOB|nr:unnamed protein product [Acanthoscelides obtectus]CAK1684702.1 hypothetical protein AOBTE_LOCUS35048 [Acanthoscelides obtectus]